MKVIRQETIYSPYYTGDKANYHGRCRWDLTDGYLGITEEWPDKPIERVLLTPQQVDRLIAFLRKRGRLT